MPEKTYLYLKHAYKGISNQMESIMRELIQSEVSQVAGGFPGFKIPFSNNFSPGQIARLQPGNALGLAYIAFQFGQAIGEGVNEFNQKNSGMSLGVSIYRTFNGGSNIPSQSSTEIDEEV